MEPAPPSGAHHLFVYGSLVDPRCLDDVLGHKHLGERLEARLAGYRRVTSPRYAYPFLVADPSSRVDGVLLMDLSPYDFQVLDRYEEIESDVYRREPVQVEAWGCGPRPIYVQADVYVAGPTLAASTTS
jgi:gamma-glutamylcyclotransferase (GGCT)/AIG2-like uncharacterized protein YtfP